MSTKAADAIVLQNLFLLNASKFGNLQYEGWQNMLPMHYSEFAPATN